jgi:iron(III) transport system ATP-binding protein
VVRREEIEIGSRANAGGAGARDDIAGVVEHVEFRGSVTGYRIATSLGTLHVDTWRHGKAYQRGDEVTLRIPANAPVVE